jgi:hypothetical protein
VQTFRRSEKKDRFWESRLHRILDTTLEIGRRVLGPENPDTLDFINNLADIYDQEGKYAQAEPLFRQVDQLRARVLGPEHPDTATAMNNLSLDLILQGTAASAGSVGSALFAEPAFAAGVSRIAATHRPGVTLGANRLWPSVSGYPYQLPWGWLSNRMTVLRLSALRTEPTGAALRRSHIEAIKWPTFLQRLAPDAEMVII